MITVELTEAEAKAVAAAIRAWMMGVNYMGPTDMEALRWADNKLTAAIDKDGYHGHTTKAA